MKWDGKKSFSHFRVWCWSTRSGSVVVWCVVCPVCAVLCCAVLCCAVLCCCAVRCGAVPCRVVSCLLCCCLSVVVCWIDIVVLLVECLLWDVFVGSKKQKIFVIVHKSLRTGIYLKYIRKKKFLKIRRI